ncbi:MAG: response regulator [Xenococcaceae cyanobacterium MO_188.B29]|nr:response regulator [Xenococcaceae cyanobacterium MO_188.B29]
MRILLVEDDRALIDVLPAMLAKHNYAIDTVTDGEQGWVYGSTYNYDLIILDWSLPKLDGISLCQRFRAHGYDTPILLLTARSTSQDKIKGLDAGADDYLCKPVDVEELAARIRALLRRLNCDFLSVLSWGELQLDSGNGEVTYQGQLLSLTAKEYRLLELFLRHSQEVLSIEDIIGHLWSSTEYPAEATVRSHLRRLRQKLQLAGLSEDPIETVRGRGYCLKSPPQNNQAEKPVEHREKHIEALTTAWSKYRSKYQQQLTNLDSAIKALKQGKITTSDRLSAIVTAHSLAGSLGLFGFERGSQLARQLEQLLQGEQNPQQLWQLETIVHNLSQELTKESKFSARLSHHLEKHSPLILIVDDDSIFIEQLVQEADNLGIKTAIAPSPESAKIWLEEQPENTFPNLVLLKISFAESINPLSRWNSLSLIAEFKLIEPSIPVIVLADRDNFQDRLQVARHGGYFYLQQPITPLQTLTFCQQVLRNVSLGKKVMIVDDDVELLRVLPSLLQPWGFQVTTLEDSRQFWDVLQAVDPNLLVLDIEMPYLSGIELCKVLRTHPYWCKLPVLFLSIHTDIAIREQVFATGADDFIYKPVVAKRLADRIINCLERRV